MLAGTVALLLGVTLFWGCDSAPVTGLEILTQTGNLAVYLQSNASLLLDTYLQYQGIPFSSSGFSFPTWQEPGLPTASLGYRKWRCLCPGIRLLLARDAFLCIYEFLQLVLDDQRSLNPQARDLLWLLEQASISSEAMISNLLTAMKSLNFQPPSIQPDPLSWTSTEATNFKKKVRGYVLCREYKDWLLRVAKDMEILKGTLTRRESLGQEKKDCCSS